MVKFDQALAEGGEGVTRGEVKALLDKRFRAHVTALGKAGRPAEAAVAAASYITYALKVRTPIVVAGLSDGLLSHSLSPDLSSSLQLVGNDTALLGPLIKLHTRSRCELGLDLGLGYRP